MTAWKILPAAKFGEFAGIWDALNSASLRSPVLEAPFVQAAIDEFADDRVNLAIGEDHGKVRSMGLLRRLGIGRWSTFQPSQAPLGLWLEETGCSTPELVLGLMPELSRGAVILSVLQQDPRLSERVPDTGQWDSVDYIETAAITLPKTFDEYWSARGKNLRHTVRRQHNKLRKQERAVRLECVSQPAAMHDAVASYARLEKSGWKGTEGTAVDVETAQGRFYCKVLESYAERGRGYVFRYWYGDDLVAVDLCVSGFGTVVVLKTAYDERERETSPAALMRHAYFQQFVNDSAIERIEFYGRAMDWHHKWADELRTMYHLNCYRWPFLANWVRSRRRSRSIGSPQTTD